MPHAVQPVHLFLTLPADQLVTQLVQKAQTADLTVHVRLAGRLRRQLLHTVLMAHTAQPVHRLTTLPAAQLVTKTG